MAFSALPQGSSLLWSIVLCLFLYVLAFLIKMYRARRIFWRLQEQGIVCDLTHPTPSLVLTRIAYRPMASSLGPLSASLQVTWRSSKRNQYGLYSIWASSALSRSRSYLLHRYMAFPQQSYHVDQLADYGSSATAANACKVRLSCPIHAFSYYRRTWIAYHGRPNVEILEKHICPWL